VFLHASILFTVEYNPVLLQGAIVNKIFNP